MSTMGMEKCFSLPVLMVLLVVGFVYHTIVFLVIEQWLSLKTATGLMNAVLFTSVTIMALISYTLAVLRDPGRVPQSYLPDVEHPETSLREVKRKGGDLRYCQKCGHYKPPRAHHCRTCKRCVLRMDHHCIWINNCVGHNNYKAFFLFLVYVVAACTYSLVLLGGYAMQTLGSGEEDSRTAKELPVSTFMATSALLKILCATVLSPLSIALIVLLAWHVYLTMHNKTTIEYHEGVRARWLAEKAGQVYRHPYDLRAFHNLVSVLGPNIATWPCPTAVKHIGSGTRYQTLYDKSSHMDVDN